MNVIACDRRERDPLLGVVLREVGPNWDWEVQRDAVGVVRVGIAHYNDDGDIDRLLAALDRLL